MSETKVRGLLGVLIDLLNWLRIYKQRDFWVQIASVVVGVFLWTILYQETLSSTAVLIVVFLSFIMTNIAWAISRKPYSCVIGGFLGYGLTYFAVSVVEYHQSLAGTLVSTLIGMAFGFIFTWFAFAIFYFIGVIKLDKKKEAQKQPQT